MVPSDEECAAIVDLRSLLEWAGVAVDGGFRASLLVALGNPVVLRDLGGISGTEVEAVVAGLMISPPAVAPAAAGPEIMATASSAHVRGCSAAGLARCASPPWWTARRMQL
jgi:hypothetical protein